MSTTRKAASDAPPSWERYMSSPEFVDERGLPGAAVTAKAALIADERERSLLFFLQALSCRRGGLKKLAADILAAFPERIGTSTMHKLGMKPGRVYTQTDAELICSDGVELGHTFDLDSGDLLPIPRERRTVEFARSQCRKMGADFDAFLGDLCTNPRVEIATASIPYFRDVVGALFEFQERHAARAREQLADTEVARKVFAAMDRALRRRKLFVIEGEPGVGKTKAVETWCEMHLGEVRFVTLSGCVNKTSIFHKIELALDLSFGQPKKSTQMQAAVESMLKRSGLMLVIDEAHFCFGQGDRITARPEIIDWIDTSCFNEGVPVALIATPQLRERLAHVERRTLWHSTQFRRRISDYVPLPAKVSSADAEAVARKLLPEGGAAAIKLLTGYAIMSRCPLSYIANAVADARELASEAGRARVEFDDIDRAIREFRVPSELAQTAAFPEQTKSRRRVSARAAQRVAVESAADEDLAVTVTPESRLQRECKPVAPGAQKPRETVPA